MYLNIFPLPMEKKPIEMQEISGESKPSGKFMFDILSAVLFRSLNITCMQV